jgi:hypothetical protein
MTDQTTAAPMRQLGIGEILDAAIKLVRQNLKALALAVLVIGLPAAIIEILITSSTTDFCADVFCDDDQTYYYTDEGAYVAGQIANGIIALFVYLLGQVACYRIVAESYLGRRIGARESLRYATRFILPTLWVSTLFVLLVGLGSILLVIPGIYLFVCFSLSYAVLLVENLRGMKALRRSRALVKGQWWSLFAVLLIAYLLTTIGQAALGFALGLPAYLLIDDSSMAGLILDGTIGLVARLVGVPLLTAVILVAYFDLRVRKEGFDLALLAERLGGPSAVDGSAAWAPPTGAPAPAAGLGGFTPPGASTPPPGVGPPVPPPPTPPPLFPSRTDGTDAFGNPRPPDDPTRG